LGIANAQLRKSFKEQNAREGEQLASARRELHSARVADARHRREIAALHRALEAEQDRADEFAEHLREANAHADASERRAELANRRRIDAEKDV
jgi:hypothetical protein